MIGTIEINGLRLRARHGVLPEERTLGGNFMVTVHLRYPIEEASETDELDSTLNYADALEIVKGEMAIPSKLLENVAGRLRKALTERFPAISGGMIRVEKLTPPMDAVLSSAAVKIEW